MMDYGLSLAIMLQISYRIFLGFFSWLLARYSLRPEVLNRFRVIINDLYDMCLSYPMEL